MILAYAGLDDNPFPKLHVTCTGAHYHTSLFLILLFLFVVPLGGFLSFFFFRYLDFFSQFGARHGVTATGWGDWLFAFAFAAALLLLSSYRTDHF